MNVKADRFAANKELSLIIQLLRFQLNAQSELKARIAELARNPALDWNEFLRLARFHKVHTHIYDTVKTLKCFPETTATELRKLNIAGSGKALAVASELKAISRLGGSRGINFTVFKGQPLSVLLYGNPARRDSKDIDLLIDIADLERIIELFAADYLRIAPLNMPLKYIKCYCSHLLYKNRRTGVIVEIHWKLLPYDCLAPGFTEAALRNTRRANVAGAGLNTLNFHYHLFYCLMHGISHRWFRLFWLVDVAEFCRKDEFVPDKLLELGKEYNVSTALGSALLLCNQLFSVPRLEENYAARLMKSRRVNRLCKIYLSQIAAGKIESDSSYLKLVKWKTGLIYGDFLLKNNFRYLAEVMNRHFVSSSDIKMLPLPEKLFFLYYPLHFILTTVRWVQWKAKAE
ncbi:MAG: nucleotidyltransferase family protein [Victivallaceae bacterium]|nr:nucleotidyltransferase family protein [Victivallaceae bacterium]